MEKLLRLAKKMLSREFQVQICASGEEAKRAALALIGKSSVGFGGSVTVQDIGLYEVLKERGNAVYWHWKTAPELRPAVFKAARDADVYVASANAVLEDGRIVNIDGNGNRVANLINGPKTIIYIIGKNKLCKTLDDGIARIKRDACPKNAQRLELPTPCAKTGKCADCSVKQRMCNVISIIERPTHTQKEVHVLLVNEPLGY
ncbi:MAG: lactate utilization protein [Eubacteriales bacterium]|nr:lactate utilization protein [Eubacteriales bacterium]